MLSPKMKIKFPYPEPLEEDRADLHMKSNGMRVDSQKGISGLLSCCLMQCEWRNRFLKPLNRIVVMKFTFLLLASLLLYTQLSEAQTFRQALELFDKNKRTESKAMLQAISKDNRESADAMLLLTLIEIDNGHMDEAFTSFSQFFQQHPSPYPYLYALWDRGLFTKNTGRTREGVKKMMASLMNDPKANLTIQAMAAASLAGRLAAENDGKAARKVYERLNDVRNWATVGTFENLSSSGYDQDYGPLTHPESGYLFKNMIGTDVKWFNIPDARNDRWLDLAFHYNITNSIIYAQTFITSESDQDVLLLLGAAGSLKVWINDFPVAGEQEERDTHLDAYVRQVKLQKGVNRILLQVGSSEIESSNFMVRFADLNGRLLPSPVSSCAYAPYVKAQAYEVKKLPFFAEQYFEAKIDDGTATQLDKLMLSSVYSRNDKRFENRRVIQQLKAELPMNSVVSEATIEAYSNDNNNTGVTREVEFLKSNDPESLISLQYRYSDAVKKEEYDEAAVLLRRQTELYGENEETQLKVIALLSMKKDYEKAIREIESAINKYPENLTLVTLEYNLQKEAYKNPQKAIRIIENYFRNHYDNKLMETLIEEKMKNNRKEEGFSLYKKMIENKPDSTGYYTKIADKYFEIQDYKSSAEWMQKAIDRAPYEGSFYYSKGLVLDASGKKQEALQCFRDAIRFSPNNYSARKKLQDLEGKKDVFQNFRENDIAALYKTAPAAAEYPNDNSIYLLKDVQQVIYDGNGASEEKTELLIKIFNKAGIDDWKEVSIPYNEYIQKLLISKAEILKKDGSKVQAESNDGELVFSSLEIGAAIHVSFRLENAMSGKLAAHFSEEFTFNGGYPVKLSRYSLLVPAGKQFNYRMYNSTMKPVVKEVEDGYKLWTWEKGSSNRIEREVSMPAFSDVIEKVVVSSFPDWSYVANWYSDLSNVKAKADFEIKEKVKELFAGRQNLSGLEKAKLIYSFIEDNFSYSDVSFLHSALTPQRASRTLNSRLGDCKDLSVLFASMAREAGLDANLILVDTRDNGDVHLDLPQIGFNHCIAQLRASGKTYIVELTDNHLPFGSMPNNLINANALYIPKDGSHVTGASLVKLNTTSRSPNTIDRTTTIRISDNNAEVVRKSLMSGAEAGSIRATYRNESDDDRRKAVTRLLSGQFNNAISVHTLKFDSLDNLSENVSEEYSFSVDNFATEIAGMKAIRLPWFDSYSSLEIVSLAERKFPLNLWRFSSTPYDKEKIVIRLPEGKKLLEVPRNVSYQCPSLSYSLTYEVKDSEVIVTREVKYLKDQVPVDEYARFKEIVIKMAEADKQQLAFK